MTKPSLMLLVACFMAATNPVLAQDAGGYQQGSAPVWPQQAPQGYEAPQYDAYRGQAQMQNAPGSSNYQQQQPIQPESNSASRMTEQQPITDNKPIKPDKVNTRKIKGAVGGIGRTLGHLALPVAGLGAIYMVTKAAARSGMMGGSGMGMMGGGMGMGGYGGGYGMGSMGGMRMPGSYGW